MKVSTQTTEMPASCALRSGSIIWTLSFGAIRIAFGLLGDDGFQDRHLERHVPLGRALIDQFGADGLGRRFGALVHGDVEAVGGQAGDQRDGDLLLSRRGPARDDGGRGKTGHTQHFDE